MGKTTSAGKATSEKESEIKREVVADSGIQWGVYSPEASKRATGTASCYRRKKKASAVRWSVRQRAEALARADKGVALLRFWL